MPIDASIYQGIKQYEQPDQVGELAKILQLKGLQSEQQLGQMKMDEYKRGVEQQNKLRGLLSSGLDPAKAALQVGDIKTATEYQKSTAEMAAKKADSAKKLVEIQGQLANSVFANPTPENAARAIAGMGFYAKQLGFGDLDFSQEAQSIQGMTPEQIKQWAAGHGLSAKDMLAKFETRDLGGRVETYSIDPITGKPSQIQSLAKTATPGEILTNQREREKMAFEQNAPQYMETEQGIVALPKKLAKGQLPTATQVTGADGSPVGGKMDAGVKKELLSINQQRASIQGALKDVQENPDAFSFGRGVAGKMPFGETLAGRMETDEQTQARSYLFNNVSKVINERAGAAQSAQELARLNSFLPADTDSAKQIENKLKAFDAYLTDIETGTRKSFKKTEAAPVMKSGAFADQEKEKRYQEWKARQGK